MGRPTDTLERMVESNDTSVHLAASISVEDGLMTRSMMGLPYLVSPIWKNGVSGVASMKFPAAYTRNSRIGSPAICPPRMNEALASMLFCAR